MLLARHCYLMLSLLLCSTFAHAYHVEVSLQSPERAFGNREQFQLFVDLKSSDVTQSWPLQVSLSLAGSVELVDTPDQCEIVDDQQADCLVIVQPHLPLEKLSLPFQLRTTGFGELQATSYVSDSESREEDFSDNMYRWVGFSARKINRPQEFENIQSLTVFDPDGVNGPDLAVLMQDGVGGYAYLNDGEGNLVRAANNRYIFGNPHSRDYLVTTINNETNRKISKPELMLFSRNTGRNTIYFQRPGPGITHNSFTPPAVFPHRKETYFLRENALSHFSGAYGLPVKVIAEDIDQDQGKKANPGVEMLYLTQNRGARLFHYSYTVTGGTYAKPISGKLDPRSFKLLSGDVTDGKFIDVNRDNRLDILLARDGTNVLFLAEDQPLVRRFPNQMFLGDDVRTVAVAALDVDLDYDIDLVFANHRDRSIHELEIFINDGTENFSKSPQVIPSARVSQLLVSDVFNDGNQELLVAQQGQLTIYTAGTNGLEYSPVSITIETPIVTADFDMDGSIDFAGDRVVLNSDINNYGATRRTSSARAIASESTAQPGGGAFWGLLGITVIIFLLLLGIFRSRFFDTKKNEK